MELVAHWLRRWGWYKGPPRPVQPVSMATEAWKSHSYFGVRSQLPPSGGGWASWIWGLVEEAWGLGVKGTGPSSDQTNLAKQHLNWVRETWPACSLEKNKQPVKDVREKWPITPSSLDLSLITFSMWTNTKPSRVGKRYFRRKEVSREEGRGQKEGGSLMWVCNVAWDRAPCLWGKKSKDRPEGV